MDTASKSPIGDAIESPTIDIYRYDDFSIIKIPGIETLPEPEQYAALRTADLGQQLAKNAFDAEALCSKLRAITPPPDEEEDDEESRLLEADARKDLESDGCPACYPPHLDVPVRNPTDEYRPIIKYWQSLSSTGDVILCAQRSDWRRFRVYQQNVRNRYQHNSFSLFVDSVCKRRQRQGLGGHVQLLLDARQQSQQQNWIEFQNYHLIHHESLEKQRARLEKKLDDCQKKADAADVESSEHSAHNERAFQKRLEFAERTLRCHEALLKWIEEQRVRMNSQSPIPVQESGGQNPALGAKIRSSPRQRRLRQFDTSAVRGKAKVSKSTLKSPDTRIQTLKDPSSRSVIVGLRQFPMAEKDRQDPARRIADRQETLRRSSRIANQLSSSASTSQPLGHVPLLRGSRKRKLSSTSDAEQSPLPKLSENETRIPATQPQSRPLSRSVSSLSAAILSSPEGTQKRRRRG